MVLFTYFDFFLRPEHVSLIPSSWKLHDALTRQRTIRTDNTTIRTDKTTIHTDKITIGTLGSAFRKRPCGHQSPLHHCAVTGPFTRKFQQQTRVYFFSASATCSPPLISSPLVVLSLSHHHQQQQQHHQHVHVQRDPGTRRSTPRSIVGSARETHAPAKKAPSRMARAKSRARKALARTARERNAPVL